MKINNINLQCIKPGTKSRENSRSYLNGGACDSFECSKKTEKAPTLNFSGILNFTPKHVVFTDKMRMPSLIQQGGNFNLEPNKFMELPANFGDIVIGKELVLDLASAPFQNLFKNMKNGENVILGRNNFDANDQTISRQHIQFVKDGGKIYIRDLESRNGTKFIANGKYKNYSKDYLMQTYSNICDFTSIIDGKYHSIRRCQYSPEETFTKGIRPIQNAIDSDPVKGRACQMGYWMYRITDNRRPGNQIVERMSLNAKADPNLLYELDELIANGRYVDKDGRQHFLSNLNNLKVEYKVPVDPLNWTKRHDTVTIYSGNKLSQDFINGVCAIGEKYQRKNSFDMPLCGAIQGKPFVANDEEPNLAKVEDLVAQAKKININLGNSIEDYVFKWEHGEKKLRCSTGMLAGVIAVMDEYRHFLEISR